MRCDVTKRDEMIEKQVDGMLLSHYHDNSSVIVRTDGRVVIEECIFVLLYQLLNRLYNKYTYFYIT